METTQTMSHADLLGSVKLQSVFHPSDFSEASEVAFAHALKVALVASSKLTLLHVKESHGAEWEHFPGVRDTLERWGLIPKGSPRSAVGQLGIDVTKVIASSEDPVKACLGFLRKQPVDLIVLAVRQHEGHMRWLEKSVGGTIARRAGQMTLFIPQGRGGICFAGGRLDLAPEHPHPDHAQTSPSSERGSRRPPDPELPVACRHGQVAPCGIRRRNALAEAPRGHRLDVERSGEGRRTV